MTHVRRGLVRGQRIEVISAGDALRKLPQLGAIQQFAQLRLADQDDLQQLLRLGLEIREQPDLLEHLGREILRLVDHQHDPFAFGVRLEQVNAQQVDQVLETALGSLLEVDAQLFADGEQELGRRHARIEDQRDLGMFRRLGQQRAHHRGLAGAHFTGELDEATGLVDAIDQVRQCLRVTFREEQETRIGRDGKRLFVEAEKRGVHGDLRTGGYLCVFNVRRPTPW